jgi:NitT/TauT family transport system substrate-binding protein
MMPACRACGESGLVPRFLHLDEEFPVKNCKRFPALLSMNALAVFALLALLALGWTGTAADNPAADNFTPVSANAAAAAPLKIGYSDWPGWLVLEIGKQKGFFKEAGVDVDLVWFADYGKSIDAYSAGKLDAIAIACGDSLKEKPSVIVVLTDFSEGNDMIIGKPGIDSIKALKGKTIGLEKNLVEHLLLSAALEKNGMTESDVKITDVKTEETTQTLKSGKVDAIGAWYPISRLTLGEVSGSKALFTSKEVPGLIYDAIQVDPDSLAKRRSDWVKVVNVWFKCLAFVQSPKTRDEAILIMAKRIDAKPLDLEANLKGTHLLDAKGNLDAMKKKNTLDSIYGSLLNADKFNVTRKVYDKAKDVDKFVDSSLVKEVATK